MRPIDRVVIIHGYGVTPEKMWFPWIHAELEKLGMAVNIPALPDPLEKFRYLLFVRPRVDHR